MPYFIGYFLPYSAHISILEDPKYAEESDHPHLLMRSDFDDLGKRVWLSRYTANNVSSANRIYDTRNGVVVEVCEPIKT